jgi:hypothetical protein
LKSKVNRNDKRNKSSITLQRLLMEIEKSKWPQIIFCPITPHIQY